MAAGITDLITRVTDSSTGRPAVTSLASPKALAAASVTITDGTNWTTEAAVYFAIYETTAAGMKIQSTQTDWKATRIGTTLSNLTLTGGTDRTYTAGAIVEQTPTARYAKDHYDWAMNQHSQTGAHTAVTATSLTTSAGVTAGSGLTVSAGSVSLPNNSIDANELATSAITLGYAQITSTFGHNTATPTLVTGLSSTVTIPAGGRKVKITVFCASLTNAGAGQVNEISIWDGTVGSGTKLSAASSYAAANNTGAPVTAMAVVTPAAGSKTYNVGLAAPFAGNTANINAAATSPAFILVEAI